ncbi:MAG: hypothetical protein WCK82_11745 [Bacteroidota bacterium]
MEKYNILKQNIKNSNLSDKDKQTLLDILTKDEIDLNSLVLTFLRLIKVGNSISKMFDLDIGE